MNHLYRKQFNFTPPLKFQKPDQQTLEAIAAKISPQMLWVPNFIQTVEDDIRTSRVQGEQERMLQHSVDSLLKEYRIYKEKSREDMDSEEKIVNAKTTMVRWVSLFQFGRL